MHNKFNAPNMNNIQILWRIPHTPTHTLHTINVTFTSPLMEAPSPLNCCTSQLNLKYKVQLITPNRTAPRYSNVFHMFSTKTKHQYTMPQQTGTPLLNATYFFKLWQYCFRTLVINLWHKPWGWNIGQGGKWMKQFWLQNYTYYFMGIQLTSDGQ